MPEGSDLVLVDDGGEAGLAVLLFHRLQLAHDQLLDPLRAAGQILQVVDLVPEGLLLLDRTSLWGRSGTSSTS